MRLRLAALLALLPLVLAACGGDGKLEPAVGAGESGAAEVAPASSELFVSINTDFDSDQWKQLKEIAKRIPQLAEALDSEEFGQADDALGPETGLVAFKLEETEDDAFVGLTQGDESKLRTLVNETDSDTVFEEIEGWQAFAGSRDLLDRLKRERNEGALADQDDFKAAVKKFTSKGK